MNTINVKDVSTFPDDDQVFWIWYLDRETGKPVAPQKKKGIDIYARPLSLLVDGASWLPYVGDGWIAVGDGTPPTNGRYLVVCEENRYSAYFDGRYWNQEIPRMIGIKATHWQPAPAAPTGQEGER